MPIRFHSLLLALLTMVVQPAPAQVKAAPPPAAGDVPVYLEEFPTAGVQYYLTDTGQGYVCNGPALRKFRSRTLVDQHRKSSDAVHLVKEKALMDHFHRVDAIITEVKRETRMVGGPGQIQTARVSIPRGWELKGFWSEIPPPDGPKPIQRNTKSGYSEFKEMSRDGKTVEAVGVKTDNAPRVLTVVLEKSEPVDRKRERR